MDIQVDKAYELKIDLIDFVDGYHQIISTLIKEIYGDDGYEWYSWFCYESDYGTRDWSTKSTYKTDKDDQIVLEFEAGEVRYGATDEDDNPICYSFESLWKYLEQNHLIINKEKTTVMKETQEEFISLYDYVGHKDENGNANYIMYDDVIRLSDFKLSIIGRGLIIHKDIDDCGEYQGDDQDKIKASLANGNAGERIACAIIGYSKDNFICN
jgi:hypothetical protein